eukprot:Platyproteum_vivax@DN3194_c0_g1_i1.p1
MTGTVIWIALNKGVCLLVSTTYVFLLIPTGILSFDLLKTVSENSKLSSFRSFCLYYSILLLPCILLVSNLCYWLMGCSVCLLIPVALFAFVVSQKCSKPTLDESSSCDFDQQLIKHVPVPEGRKNV